MSDVYDESMEYQAGQKYLTGDGVMDFYEKFLSFKKVVDNIPDRAVRNRGWINPNDGIGAYVDLFESIATDRIKPLFRKNDEANDALCSLWVSRVSHIANLKVSLGETKPFDGLTRDSLETIAKLSVDEGIFEHLPDILGNLGIIFVVEPSFPGMKLDGAVFTLPTGTPVIAMSLRYPRLDYFWFTLLHELSHVVLHYELLDSPIFEDLDSDSESVVESQANRLAKNSIVSRTLWRNCKPKYDRSSKSIVEFSKEVGVHPAIIAGLLQREFNDYSLFRDLVDAVNVRELIFEKHE